MKRSGIFRAVSAVSAAVLLVGCLAGCGGGGKSGDGYVYVPTITELPELSEGMGSVSVSGDRLYFTTNVMVFPDGTPLTEQEQEEYRNYWDNKYSTMDMKAAMSSTVTPSDVAPEGATEGSTEGGDSKYENATYTQKLMSMKLDGSDQKVYSDYTAPMSTGNYSYAGLNNIAVDPKGHIWVLESDGRTVFNMPDGLEPTYENIGEHYDEYFDHEEQNYSLKRLTDTGATELEVDLSDMVPDATGKDDYYYINSVAADASGNLVVADSNQSVGVYSPKGEFMFTAPVDGYVNNLLYIGGKIYCYGYNDEGKSSLTPLDVSSRSLGKAETIPDSAYTFMGGGSKYDFSFTNGDSLFGYKFGDEEPTKILSWLSCDLNGDSIAYCTVLDNDDVLAVGTDYTNDKSVSYIVKLVKTPASEVTRKETLTVACLYTDYNLRAKILAFNKTDAPYRIEIHDYSEYNTDENYTAGLTKLNTEIISGNAPDMIAIDNFSYEQYAAKGLLEDLYPYMTGEVSKDSFIPSILKVQETDGKLFSIATGFTPMTLVGSSDRVGTETGWTIEEMKDIIAQNPNADAPLGNYMTRDQILYTFLGANYSEYIDWATGKCSFDTQEFKDMLNYAASFPSSESINAKGDDGTYVYVPEQELIATGRQLLSTMYLWDFNSVQDAFHNYGDKLVNKGFPSADKQGTVTRLGGCMAITSTCKNKDAAWEFISSLLTESAQNEMWDGMPVNQKAFDAKLKEAMVQQYDENGEPVSNGGWSDGTTEVKYYAITQPQADFILNVINSISRIAYDSDAAQELIIETVTPFFDGSKTVDQVCTELQSKMTMFVNEQR